MRPLIASAAAAGLLMFMSAAARADDHKDQCDEATLLSPYATEFSGVIDGPQDQDWIAVPTEPGRRYLIRYPLNSARPDISTFSPSCQPINYPLGFNYARPLSFRASSDRVLLRLTAPYAMPYRFEIEPGEFIGADDGDIPALATPLVVEGREVLANLYALEDEDWFRLTGARPRDRLKLTFTGMADTDGTADLSLIGGSTEVFHEAQFFLDGRSTRALTFIVPMSADPMYVVLKSGLASYSLSVSRIESLPVTDDFGNACTNAAVLPPGEVEAVLFPGDQDVFAVNTIAGHVYEVRVRVNDQPQDLLLNQLDAACRPVGTTRSASLFSDAIVQQLAVSTGMMLFRVQESWTHLGNRYTLRITDQGALADDFGQVIASAGVLQPDGVAVKVQTDYPEDVDLLRLPLVPGMIYQLTARSNSWHNVDLTLLGSSGQTVATGRTMLYQWIRQEQTFEFLLPGAIGDPIDWYLRTNSDRTGNLTLACQPLLPISTIPNGPACEQAIPALPNGPAQWFVCGGASQWFNANLQPGRQYRVQVASQVLGSQLQRAMFFDCLDVPPALGNQVIQATSPELLTVRITGAGAGTFRILDEGPTVDAHPHLPELAITVRPNLHWTRARIDFNEDRDLMLLHLRPDTAYVLEVEPGPGADPADRLIYQLRPQGGGSNFVSGWLYSYDGVETTQFTSLAGNNQPYALTFESFDANPTPGDYRFRIYPAACHADWNDDGRLTVDDLFAYLQAFASDPVAADVDLFPGTTISDLLEYLAAFQQGCP